MIQDSNYIDPRLTVEDQNAYNVRIRKFFQFLEMKAQLPYGTHQALYCMVATKENIVATLSDEEKTEIAEKHEPTASWMELHNRSILLLGLRTSDTINMKLSHIDWKCQSIQILQKKTQHKVYLLILSTGVPVSIH